MDLDPDLSDELERLRYAIDGFATGQFATETVQHRFGQTFIGLRNSRAADNGNTRRNDAFSAACDACIGALVADIDEERLNSGSGSIVMSEILEGVADVLGGMGEQDIENVQSVLDDLIDQLAAAIGRSDFAEARDVFISVAGYATYLSARA